MGWVRGRLVVRVEESTEHDDRSEGRSDVSHT